MLNLPQHLTIECLDPDPEYSPPSTRGGTAGQEDLVHRFGRTWCAGSGGPGAANSGGCNDTFLTNFPVFQQLKARVLINYFVSLLKNN